MRIKQKSMMMLAMIMDFVMLAIFLAVLASNEEIA